MKSVPEKKGDGLSFLVLGLFYAAMMAPLLTMKAGFVNGDYSLQMYPWSKIYSEAIKAGYLPLWTDLIQCGFPLFAEGQTGMLYLLNLLLFKLLPFHAAYNGMFLLHFLMAYIFTYLFARKQKLSRQAAMLACLCFVFGSAYAGCFYNIVAMRSLVWFPLMLYCVDAYFETKRLWTLLLLSLAQSQSWLGGFPQLALYASLFTGLYAIYKGKKASFVMWTALFLSGLLSAVVALPQIWATFELAGHTTRVLQDKTFIFWGSVPPWSVITLFMYSWIRFLKVDFYIGVIPVLLLLTAPGLRKRRGWWVLTGISFLLAMGMFNPFYWVLAHLPGASLLRNPSKFLFFTSFFLAVLAGFSFDEWRHTLDDQSERWARRIRLCLYAFLGVGAFAFFFVRSASGLLLKAGRWYVEKFILHKSYHIRPAEEYLAAVKAYLANMQTELNFSNIFFWLPFVFGILFLVFHKLAAKSGRLTRYAGLFVIVLLATDLGVYSFCGYGTAYKLNIGPFADVSKEQGYPRDGRWLILEDRPHSLFPANRNILTGHAVVGAYSPLLDKDYFLLLKDIPVLDDSFGLKNILPDAADKNKTLADFLGARYVTTDANTKLNFYTLLSHDTERNIYKNRQALPEFTVNGVRSAWIQVISSSPTDAEIVVQSAQPALLTRNQIYDNGWQASVNGQKTPITRYLSAFQSVPISKGESRVRFSYRPAYVRIGLLFYFMGLLIITLGLIVPPVRKAVIR